MASRFIHLDEIWFFLLMTVPAGTVRLPSTSTQVARLSSNASVYQGDLSYKPSAQSMRRTRPGRRLEPSSQAICCDELENPGLECPSANDCYNFVLGEMKTESMPLGCPNFEKHASRACYGLTTEDKELLMAINGDVNAPKTNCICDDCRDSAGTPMCNCELKNKDAAMCNKQEAHSIRSKDDKNKEDKLKVMVGEEGTKKRKLEMKERLKLGIQMKMYRLRYNYRITGNNAKVTDCKAGKPKKKATSGEAADKNMARLEAWFRQNAPKHGICKPVG